uniref:dTDP-4-amino-4,6-dideoxygalactose transaminase n=1 Tax=Candidatus Kentrum sp. FW TaxID=2126338 RepID=A0A450THZ6_9GAMM|nr:MAG: dTDP-4-amino-4,6-dideoxygalactose transaminase [Candidatus Kentron sp. FW]
MKGKILEHLQNYEIKGDRDYGGSWPTYDKGAVLIGKDEIDSAKRVVSSKRLFRYDNRSIENTEVGVFENDVCQLMNIKYCLATSSGTSAITLALMGAGVIPGDEVICSSFGFPSTVSAILLTGAKPVFVEVNENLHLDIEDLKKKITSHTRAVLMIHMRGQVGDVFNVLKVCKAANIPLIEDAVPTLGLRLGNQFTGTIGDFGAFSTQSDKSINTGEGGFVVTNDRKAFEKIILLSGAYETRANAHFRDHKISLDERKYPLFNFRMDEVRAAIARPQVQKLLDRVAKLQRNYSFFVDALSNYTEVVIREPGVQGGNICDSMIFHIEGLDDYLITKAVEALRSEGVDCRRFGGSSEFNARSFWNWHYAFPGLSENDIKKSLPASYQYINKAIDIPLSPLIGEKEIAIFNRAIRKVLG